MMWQFNDTLLQTSCYLQNLSPIKVPGKNILYIVSGKGCEMETGKQSQQNPGFKNLGPNLEGLTCILYL